MWAAVRGRILNLACRIVGRGLDEQWSTAYSQLLPFNPLEFPADADASLATLLASESSLPVDHPMELPRSAVLARDALTSCSSRNPPPTRACSVRRPFLPTSSPDHPNSRYGVVLSKPISVRPMKRQGWRAPRGSCPRPTSWKRRALVKEWSYFCLSSQTPHPCPARNTSGLS